MFEVRYTDLAARIGRLETPHGTVETPAFVPVVHPVRQTISPQFLKKMGFDLVITNAYITFRHYGGEARKRGIHDIIGFDGSVMTDSGGYQVLEYGSVEVEPSTMAQFEKDIKSDIPIPLDKPTGYGLPYEKASEYVRITLENCKKTLEVVGETDAVWVGPVQGAEHYDLVEHSAKALDGMGYQLMALGSPVEVMEAYEFATLARMIARYKKAIPAKPIHLFGAGHPLTIPLAIALGCDTFDSASYMLYAKDDRYMQPQQGTARLADLAYLPCQCPICSSYKLDELRALPKDQKTIEIAKHNLHVLKAEVDACKQAIMDGRLWEYVMQKARAHPKLMEAVQLFGEGEFGFMADNTPAFKEKAIFFFDQADQHRPEARRFRQMAAAFKSKKKKLVLFPEGEVHPFYSTKGFKALAKKFPDAQLGTYNPFLGVIPAEISDVFPASHNLTSRLERKLEDYPSFTESLDAFLANNSFGEVIVVADDFMKQAKKLNARVEDYSNSVIDRL